MQNKRAQVGETVTWIVATIIIVSVLIFFVFGAAMLGSTKQVGEFKDSLFSKAENYGQDNYLKKSLYTYLSLNSDTLRKTLVIELDEAEEAGEFEVSYKEELSDLRRTYNRR